MIEVVTTFSKDGYDLYGHRMIETWLKFWPDNHSLIVYTEDFDIDEKDQRITQINLNSECQDLLEFKRQSQLIEQSLTDKKKIARIQKTVKWSHKVFAISHALKNCQSNFLLFLDGDTYTKSKIDQNLVSNLVENNLIAVHFENLSEGLHFETGLLAFNLNHPQMDKFKNLYTSGYVDLSIYEQKKTWDTFWLVKLYQDHKLEIKDLSKNKKSSVFGNPLIYNKIIHDVGTKKYADAGYNKYTGKKK